MIYSMQTLRAFFRVLEMSAGIPFQSAGEKKMLSGRLFLRLWMVKLFCAG